MGFEPDGLPSLNPRSQRPREYSPASRRETRPIARIR